MSSQRKAFAAAGFTMIEVMVALVLAVLASGMVYMTFSAVIRAWRSGMNLAEDLHHGDFVMEQLVLGLRSAYYPDSAGVVKDYGFWMESGGFGGDASDSISWVKQGIALSDSNSPMIAVPHRVRFSVEEDSDGRRCAAVRFWIPEALEDFDASRIEPQCISSRVTGFECRVATNMTEEGLRKVWDWQDEWKDEATNRLPCAVELTLYLEPLEKGQSPVEMKRCVEIPIWRLSAR